MTKKQDYYEALGVNKQADADSIKKAYRRLAMKYHPDRNKDNKEAEKKFKYINEAYSVLSDEQKRAAYDQFGHQAVDGSAGGGPTGAGGFDFSEDIFGKIFEEFVGGNPFGGGGSRVHAGQDLSYKLALSLEEAISGLEKEIEFRSLATCDTCHGKGAKSASDIVTCPTCNGVGQVRIQQGFISLQQPCPHCRGKGTIIKNPCPSCNGRGRKEKLRKVAIKVPAGIDDGNRIRLTGEGEASPDGGPAGDLYIEVQVKPHPIFTREGNDLHCEAPLQFTQAALGSTVEIPTITGKVTIKIPPETQTGATFRLRGKGVKSLRGSSTGDLICKVKMETPVRLSSEQRDLLEKFAQSLAQGGDKHNPKTVSWFNRIKQFFQNISS
ncbi:MAG: molecular chaperone DnaJ [Pseudomonadota bacterium]|nr:molecular chaperone DnaJ [Pseudomonadota bacterium]